MIDKKTEEKMLLPTICKMISMKISGVNTMIDYGTYEEGVCDPFQLFFVLNPNIGDSIDPDTADGSQTIYQLASRAAELITDRYNNFYQLEPWSIGHIGFCIDSTWTFGKENIPEIEAMVGSVYDKDVIIGLWSFNVRFAPVINQIEGRCLFAEPEFLDDEESIFGDY